MFDRCRHGCAIAIIASAICPIAQAQTATPSFVPPPRTITDIAATLDQEKPKPENTAKVRQEADADAPAGLGPAQLAAFLERRGRARANLGRQRDGIADLARAVEVGKGHVDPPTLARMRLLLVQQLRLSGDYKASLESAVILAREADKGAKAWLFGTYRATVQTLLAMGDFGQADTYVRRSEALFVQGKSWPQFSTFGVNWESEIQNTKALIFEAKGQFREAELAYRKAEVLKDEFLRRMDKSAGVTAVTMHRAEQEAGRDGLIANQGRVKARQGRMAEAEADVRRALLNRLNAAGKYAVGATWYLDQLANVLIDQGRYSEAEGLLRSSLQIRRDQGAAADGPSIASCLSQLARVVNYQRRYKESAEIFAELDGTIKGWEPKRREAMELNSSRIYQHFASGHIATGIAAAEKLLARNISRFGTDHVHTAMSRGILAVGLARAGRDEDAIREFKASVGILSGMTRENEQEDADFAAQARSQGIQLIIEEYIALLARKRPGESEIAEAFGIVDTLRAQSLQRALAASSARLLAGNAKLAELVRKEQDLEKQVNAQAALLNNVLTLPAVDRDEKVVRDLRTQVDKLRAERVALRKNLSRSFPGYADLVDPKPPSIEEVRAVLRPDEALLSFYLGRFKSFVWAVPKEGPAGFAVINGTNAAIEQSVRRLREALEPKGETIEDIPAFDVDLAHQLYTRLLKPLEASWRPAKRLIVVTNGALGLLPIAVLPTAPAVVAQQTDPRFADYRSVPWLARTHAVASVPSAAALRTSRLLPVERRAPQPFVGFADPLFSVAQASETPATTASQSEATATRGLPLRRRAVPKTLGVDSADLALLPRLPDTAEELKSIAGVLTQDSSKVLHLGKDANERKIRDGDLSQFRIIAFATHGLVPGELNGLSQPALAFTAPDVAGVDGDGLLTMEEVLALKLNADWVVLSACNTGTGSGAGAEAASGLGRAFFYAGAKTLLLTNWSVHSASASQLVTDIFRRQAADPQLTRAGALQQAMLALMDGPGWTDQAGKTHFTYAHPLFWAPYTIVGDGGSP